MQNDAQEADAAIPWVEKYRPQEFDSIVLEPANKKLLENIIKTGYFPNLLLHGPPGTGKTTTIVNLIAAFQQKFYGRRLPPLVMQLNASDERGIDTIRSQIQSFVNTQGLFHTGVKFIVLDEVDYMTKNAQHAFRYLLTDITAPNVRFCLMCNYISKIEHGLQNNFLKLRFNQLPTADITAFLRNIIQKEAMGIDDVTLQSIQTYYQSDIRSMINFLQTNQGFMTQPVATKARINKKNLYTVQLMPHMIQILDDTVWDTLVNKIREGYCRESGGTPCQNLTPLIEYMYSVTLKYNIDIKAAIKQFLRYLIYRGVAGYDSAWLFAIEKAVHVNIPNDVYLKYILTHCIALL
jgi:DNA polymerase III delta prime subunit